MQRDVDTPIQTDKKTDRETEGYLERQRVIQLESRPKGADVKQTDIYALLDKQTARRIGS